MAHRISRQLHAEVAYYTNDYICKSCYLNQHVVVVAIENNQSSQKEIINLIELFIKNLLEENAYGV